MDIRADTLQEGKKAVEAYGTKVRKQAILRNHMRIIEAKTWECIAIEADVSKEEDVKRAIEEAVAEFGRIDYAA